ncbi:hypothetical protein SPRG_04119 [Saprolegnia parasitica CBS 223.65]|uniref:Sm domain-containing protein n=1 Tax=Saprolegnia parasitica (strain CBS 223.65) TaxID=695850 RepID=A0A067CQH4_SAPPC|nr:hypothetical protein SPRG_04119 [Saprolegnia parasitica CBS 223.65]KDO31505.1 hypothetical protein SPRG_04119 [Saprolegnia parasitica CBS 223.65]|eukprot:XP_012198092.1 hypothetical protein SPRG_04119 [Saprolegnia parasitica CBS 223.65]
MLGMEITIELKTEHVLTGMVEEVSQGMDVRLSHVRQVGPTGKVLDLDELFVMGRMILYVHIPDRIHINTHMKDYVHMVERNKKMYKRAVRKPTLVKPNT